MATQPVSKPISQGKCAFCKAELAKNKMTQHLKSCKQRLATIATQEKTSQQPKTQLFHILAEGKYNPQYWLHFEVSAAESLWVLDNFLKDMWIDDLDHLSSFTINATEYGIDYPDEMLFVDEPDDDYDEEEISAEDDEKEVREIVDKIVSGFTRETESFYYSLPFGAAPLSAEWVAEIKKPRSVDDLIDFLKKERVNVTKAYKDARMDARGKIDMSEETVRANYLTAISKKSVVEDLLDAIEDRSVDVALKRVLKVGQKFSYTYDFGSSTYINLKVIAEREGILSDDQKKVSVQLLARNTAPTFSCTGCGKPAKHVLMGYFTDSIADSTFCTHCLKKQKDVYEGMSLPIINSPRVGVL